ncbi:hypothetical protein OAU26_09035, partial [Mariniblastus sp.]|nr:hypothetical protein [Mariniblastus sp.]
LESLNLLDSTLVVMTGDHGMPFPRCKSNLYDSGAESPWLFAGPARFLPAGKLPILLALPI